MTYRLIEHRSIESWRRDAAAWNDLWRRSDVALPLAAFEPLELWYRHFAAEAPPRILAVADGSRYVAGLPLYGSRLRGWLPVGRLPVSPWSLGGNLLLDPQADWREALGVLVREGLANSAWPWLWLEPIESDSPRWLALVEVLNEAGISSELIDLTTIDETLLPESWEAYLASRSRNHRRNIRRRWRSFAAEGGRLIVHRQPAVDALRGILRRGFEVETRCWKHRRGSTVLETPGMFDFYCAQARVLAERDQLLLALLELNARPIAFQYGFLAKGCYSLMKIAYDEAYAKLSPGQLLMGQMIHWMEEHEPELKRLDFLGPSSEATRSWRTGSYRVARLVAAPGRVVGRSLLASYRVVRPVVRRLRAARSRHASARAVDPTPVDPASKDAAAPVVSAEGSDEQHTTLHHA